MTGPTGVSVINTGFYPDPVHSSLGEAAGGAIDYAGNDRPTATIKTFGE